MILDKSNKKTIAVALGVVVVLSVVAALLAFFMNGKRIDSVSGFEDTKIDVIICEKTGNSQGLFFGHSGEKMPVHQVKILFKNGMFDGFNFTYSAKYNSAKSAEDASSRMLGKYNIYMAEIGIYQEDLTPVFSVVDMDVKINLFIAKDKFTMGTAKLVSLSEDEFMSIDGYKIDDFRKIYEEKGFTCQYNQ